MGVSLRDPGGAAPISTLALVLALPDGKGRMALPNWMSLLL